jgi:hypothetical protein
MALAECFVCGTATSAPTMHNVSIEAAKAIGPKRCRICGKGARVRCIVGAGNFWVECADGHLTHTQA